MAHAVRFYRAADGEVRLPPPDLGDLSLTRWQPHRDGPPTGLFAGNANRIWWAMDLAGQFPRTDLTVYAIHRRENGGDTLLHRLLVTPRWHRFPFMGRLDMQMGDLWTAPAMRGQGLAAKAIAAVQADFAGKCPALWYVVDEDNAASIRLIERIGYRLEGTGVRTRPLGLGPLGQFRMTSVRPRPGSGPGPAAPGARA
ncbi:GNAT family N-acetyltransferase [Tsuneonella sp. HG222]